MSTLFNLKPQPVEKPIFNHPWEKTIKGSHSIRMKYAHNSIKNPHYPQIKEKANDKDCVKFTVIGDRITKEFIYCATVVKGLHNYRRKKFDVPIIRGVTTVEWPEIWRNLKIQHGGIAHCIQTRVAVLINDKILGGDKELKELIESKYIYHLTLDYYNEAVKQFAIYIRSSGRPCAYMHISIDDEHIGTMIFMLYSDILPYTCENFLRLCKETKGGYSGTPIHRIVKDGWIQCGGFGLKSTDLDCENFIVPHDRRGVLCMANDGRHIDCSTQFFILLQPAPWMANKYVAFGQLIEGEKTLEKIENVPTWYESPSSNIVIYKAGIFNMECQDITINKGTNEYIYGHIEDLNALGESLLESLIARVFLEIELKLVQNLEKELLLGEEVMIDGAETGNIHATKRFIRRKEDIHKQLEAQIDAGQSKNGQGYKSTEGDYENNEFDVEDYELEESLYQHQSIVTSSLVVKPEKPFYIPLTDVTYPGEVDSTYDLKKFLKGDYCLESDLDRNASKKAKNVSYPWHLITISKDDSECNSYSSLESEDEKEIRQYLEMNSDRVSFAGEVIKNISRGFGKYNLLENFRRSQLISDDELRRIRLASIDMKNRDAQNKKVSLSIPNAEKGIHGKIKRRQTGFVRPEDIEKVRVYKKSSEEIHENNEDDETHKAVRIAESALNPNTLARPARRPTGFVRMTDAAFSDANIDETNVRPSVMHRLYENVSKMDNNGPTLKDYKPLSEMKPTNMLLTFSPYSRIRSEDSTKEKFLRYSMTKDDQSFEDVLNVQHNKKMARKISSDYVKTMDQMSHKFGTSIRSIEYAKTRPSMTVSAYQTKNMKYQEELRNRLEKNVKQPEKNIGEHSVKANNQNYHFI